MEYSEYLDIEDELEQLNDIEKELSLSSEQSKRKAKTAPVKLSYKQNHPTNLSKFNRSS